MGRLALALWRTRFEGRLAVMSSLARTLVTEAEFLRLPETTEKIELIDGEVNASPSPTYWHQEVLGRLVAALRLWASTEQRPVLVGQTPLDVRFAPGRILQPDAFVAFIELSPSHEGPIDHVPALCIEVLSQNRVYDRVTKRFIYALAGCTTASYWSNVVASTTARSRLSSLSALAAGSV